MKIELNLDAGLFNDICAHAQAKFKVPHQEIVDTLAHLYGRQDNEMNWMHIIMNERNLPDFTPGRA